METYRWFVIVLLFLLAISGTVIGSLVSCVDRNPVADREGRVIQAPSIPWLMFGFLAFGLFICIVFIVIYAATTDRRQVFGLASIILVILVSLMLAVLTGLFWSKVNQPLNLINTADNMEDVRLQTWVLWVYFLSGLLISQLALRAMMAVAAIAIKTGGCEPDLFGYLPEYVCDYDLDYDLDLDLDLDYDDFY